MSPELEGLLILLAMFVPFLAWVYKKVSRPSNPPKTKFGITHRTDEGVTHYGRVPLDQQDPPEPHRKVVNGRVVLFYPTSEKGE